MSPEQNDIKKLAYTAAQEMLKHYDTLNWQIGSILIAGVMVLTGLVINKDTVELMRTSPATGWAITAGIPTISFIILGAWWFWFRRHRDLYNLRNEVFHRLELQLGMYHYLRVAEADMPRDFASRTRMDKARKEAGYGTEGFSPLYPASLSRPSGFQIATFLAQILPLLQYTILRALYLGKDMRIVPSAIAFLAALAAVCSITWLLTKRSPQGARQSSDATMP